MGTAIFTGVSGLLSFQRRLDVIASNIANINTTGYRGSRVLFQDLFSQTLEGARATGGGFGGSNPLQVGLGVRVATIDTNFSQGSLITTGVASDLAIQGSGFFTLSDGTTNLFTRDGSFALNSGGFLIDPATGLFVQGFQANSAGVITTDGLPTNLSIPVGGQAIVRPTSFANLVGNLNSDAVIGQEGGSDAGVITRTIRVFDSLGTARDLTVTFTKRLAVDVSGGETRNAWEFSVTFENTEVANVAAGRTGVLLFDSNGLLVDSGSLDGPGGQGFVSGFGTPPDPNSPADSVLIPEVLFTGNDPQNPLNNSIPVTPFTFDLRFNDISELAGESDVTLSNQDGLPRGVLESFNIGDNGTLNGIFSNGLTVVIGQVALATFANVGGLQRAGSNLFRDTPSSGNAQIGAAGSGGRGSITGGVLEGSNVDLGTEFSNMIVTQRGFQANARTITAADLLLQEAVDLIR